MKWKLNRDKVECPSCGEENNHFFYFNRILAKPRAEHKCTICGQEWHYSKQGYAMDNYGQFLKGVSRE